MLKLFQRLFIAAYWESEERPIDLVGRRRLQGIPHSAIPERHKKKVQQKMGRRLVLFPFPFAGHQKPMFEIANILHSKGFSITVISTNFLSPNPAKYPHFSFHLIGDGLSKSEYMGHGIALINLLNKKCMVPFRECLSQILSSASEEEPVACLVADTMWYCSQAVADSLGLPRILLRSSNITFFTTCFAIPSLREKGHLALRDMKAEDLISELPPLRVKDISGDSEGDQSPLHEFLSMLARESKASKGIIFNSFEEIEDRSLAITQQEFSIPIFPCGPFHRYLSSPCTSFTDQDQSCISWLDTQAPDSVLYVSFGTHVSIDEAMFVEMAWGLANSNQSFLWVVRSDLVRSSSNGQLPDGFLQEVSGRGHIVSWAPQKDVLGHPAVGGFWTHSGWNSTLESICEGVPMICSPCFGDQMVNARYASDVWKIGLQLEVGAKRKEMEKAIRKLMAEKEGADMRDRATSLKNKANNCLLLGGSSCKYMQDLVNLILSF